MRHEFVDTIKEKTKYIATFIDGAGLESDPVRVNNYKRFYKNGNVKAYISDLSVQNPSKHIEVRNRKYNLYSKNFNHTYNFLYLYYFSEKYNLLIDSFIDKYTSRHTENFDNFLNCIKHVNATLKKFSIWLIH